MKEDSLIILIDQIMKMIFRNFELTLINCTVYKNTKTELMIKVNITILLCKHTHKGDNKILI